jgi:hypothetical protein
MDAIDSSYCHIFKKITRGPACGFSKFEHVIKNGFNVLPAKCLLHADIRARKRVR